MKRNAMQEVAFKLDEAERAIDDARSQLHHVPGTDHDTDQLREMSRKVNELKRSLYERSQAEPAPA